jgi:mono/diheme cytochrome c family protein
MRALGMLILIALLSGAIAFAALGADARQTRPPAATVEEAPPSAAQRAAGAALVAAGECSRCHAVTGLPGVAAAPRDLSCAGCHAWIHATADDPAARARERRRFPTWDRYVNNVRSFLALPDLGLAAARLDRRWLARYLRAPYDVRPGLPEEMIRTAFTEEQAEAVAAWLVTTARARVELSAAGRAAAAVAVSARPADVAAGEALYGRLGCAACHALGARPAVPGLPAAPDLAHARDRMRPADIAALIADPAAFGIEERMPRYELTAAEAARLRDFLLAAPMPARPVAAGEPDLPLLARPVSYQEVRERVLGAICVHCHMDPARNAEGGGPGNTGGLTYAGAGLDLETWEGLRRGSLRGGRRVSVLAAPPEGGEPTLIARLRARSLEHGREQAGASAVVAGGAPGMPLGLPPLAAADLQLVRSWVAQGAPGPRRRD